MMYAQYPFGSDNAILLAVFGLLLKLQWLPATKHLLHMGLYLLLAHSPHWVTHLRMHTSPLMLRYLLRSASHTVLMLTTLGVSSEVTKNIDFDITPFIASSVRYYVMCVKVQRCIYAHMLVHFTWIVKVQFLVCKTLYNVHF